MYCREMGDDATDGTNTDSSNVWDTVSSGVTGARKLVKSAKESGLLTKAGVKTTTKAPAVKPPVAGDTILGMPSWAVYSALGIAVLGTGAYFVMSRQK